MFIRSNTYVFATEPFWFSIWFRESCFEHNLFILSFLCMLIDKWAQEAVCFLFAKKRFAIIKRKKKLVFVQANNGGCIVEKKINASNEYVLKIMMIFQNSIRKNTDKFNLNPQK